MKISHYISLSAPFLSIMMARAAPNPLLVEVTIKGKVPTSSDHSFPNLPPSTDEKVLQHHEPGNGVSRIARPFEEDSPVRGKIEIPPPPLYFSTLVLIWLISEPQQHSSMHLSRRLLLPIQRMSILLCVDGVYS